MENTTTTVINEKSNIKFKIINWIDNNQDALNILKFKKELANKILRE